MRNSPSLDFEVDALQDLGLAEALDDVSDGKRAHVRLLLALHRACGQTAHEVLAGHDVDEQRRQGRR